MGRTRWLWGLLVVAAGALAQPTDPRVSLRFENTPLTEILAAVGRAVNVDLWLLNAEDPLANDTFTWQVDNAWPRDVLDGVEELTGRLLFPQGQGRMVLVPPQAAPPRARALDQQAVGDWQLLLREVTVRFASRVLPGGLVPPTRERLIDLRWALRPPGPLAWAELSDARLRVWLDGVLWTEDVANLTATFDQEVRLSTTLSLPAEGPWPRIDRLELELTMRELTWYELLMDLPAGDEPVEATNGPWRYQVAPEPGGAWIATVWLLQPDLVPDDPRSGLSRLGQAMVGMHGTRGSGLEARLVHADGALAFTGAQVQRLGIGAPGEPVLRVRCQTQGPDAAPGAPRPTQLRLTWSLAGTARAPVIQTWADLPLPSLEP